MNIIQPKYNVVFLSAEKAELDKAENKKRTETLRLDLERSIFGFKEVSGRFDGVDEVSFMVAVHGKLNINLPDTYVDKLLDLAGDYQQDCILLRNMHREAFLMYPNGSQERLGHMVSVGKSEAVKGDFTYDKDNDTYWTIK